MSTVVTSLKSKASPRKAPCSEAGDSAFFCFEIRPQELQPRKRARYDARRRKEVGAVRKRGACLRCRLLKVTCSGDDPCARCMKLALSTEGKCILRLFDCIRTSLKDVSIFEHNLPPLHQRGDVSSKAQHLAMTPITLSFASHVNWSLNTLTADIVTWLNGTDDWNTSKVGTLSSPNFLSLVQSSIGSQACLDFQQMLYAQSLAYTQLTASNKHYPSVSELQQISGLAGHSFLMELDRKLRPTVLAGCSKDGLQALFLVIFGTILAVGYASPLTESPILPLENAQNSTAKQRPSSLYMVMQEHLCRTLAHYLVYIGSRLDLSIPRNAERALLDGAHARWNKEGLFLWLLDDEEESEEIELTKEDIEVLPETSAGLDKSWEHNCDLNQEFSADDWMEILTGRAYSANALDRGYDSSSLLVPDASAPYSRLTGGHGSVENSLELSSGDFWDFPLSGFGLGQASYDNFDSSQIWPQSMEVLRTPGWGFEPGSTYLQDSLPKPHAEQPEPQYDTDDQYRSDLRELSLDRCACPFTEPGKLCEERSHLARHIGRSNGVVADRLVKFPSSECSMRTHHRHNAQRKVNACIRCRLRRMKCLVSDRCPSCMEWVKNSNITITSIYMNLPGECDSSGCAHRQHVPHDLSADPSGSLTYVNYLPAKHTPFAGDSGNQEMCEHEIRANLLV